MSNQKFATTLRQTQEEESQQPTGSVASTRRQCVNIAHLAGQRCWEKCRKKDWILIPQAREFKLCPQEMPAKTGQFVRTQSLIPKKRTYPERAL